MAEKEPVGWGKDDGEGDKFGDKRDKEWMLAGEVTSRRRHKVSKEEVDKAKDEYVSMEWSDIFPKKPMDRLRWLYKALIGAKERRVKVNQLFDIITHRKFLEGLKGNIATDTLNLIRGHMDLFSGKQKKQLTSDNFELFRKYAPISVLDSDDDEADAAPLPPPPTVVVEPKDKKRKKNQEAQQNVRREESEDEGDEELDTETKRRKILAKGIERRIDPSDGQAYTLTEFIAEYGGTADKPPVTWDNARHSAFIFKA